MLKILGVSGMVWLHKSAVAATCTPTTPTVTEGPYWVDEQLFRSDVRTDPSTGALRAGVPLDLTIKVVNSAAACAPLVGAYVDIWHCDAIGIYSDESTYNPGGGTGNVNTTGQRFLRGYQITDDQGQVLFETIYPGWYSGRTIHIHARIRTHDGSTVLTDFVTQIFFDEATNNLVMAQAPYNSRTSARDTLNATDMVYTGAQNRTLMLATLTPRTAGSGYAAAIEIDINASVGALAAPVIGPNAVVNAGSGAPGAAPGTWVSIFGTNLAGASYTLGASDVVDNNLPTSLQNVSVQIDGKAAFLDYVSPGQINVLIPEDSNSGSVTLTVSGTNGTSGAAKVTLQPMLPGLFAQGGYASAFRPSDGATPTANVPVTAGDILEIFGTGFGPTSPRVASGLIFSGGAATENTVTVKIGGIDALVLWSGMIGAGLYQINVVVPAGLAAGDNAIVASVGGYSTQSTAMLKVA